MGRPVFFSAKEVRARRAGSTREEGEGCGKGLHGVHVGPVQELDVIIMVCLHRDPVLVVQRYTAVKVVWDHQGLWSGVGWQWVGQKSVRGAPATCPAVQPSPRRFMCVVAEL